MKTEKIGRATIHNCDCMDFLKGCEDNQFDLIICDPPYYQTKGEFDFIWKSFNDYLLDVEKWAKEIKRISNDSCSLLWWGNDRKIAYSQIILDKYFRLENSMIWEKKDSIQYQYYSPDMARRFNTHNERVLYYSTGKEPEEFEKTGLQRILEEHVNPKSPFAKYLKSEFKKAGVTNKEIARLFPSKTGGLTGCVSNWLNGSNVITEQQYLKIRDYLNNEYLRLEYEDLRLEYEDLRLEYEDLRLEYEDLRLEYEDLRRPFKNYLKLSDVLKFSQEGHITRKYNHPTQKAPRLCRSLIEVIGKVNGKAFIPFVGSGTEIIELNSYGMDSIGCELDKDYYKMACERIRQAYNQPDMFTPTQTTPEQAQLI